jgi:hypothetical protein
MLKAWIVIRRKKEKTVDAHGINNVFCRKPNSIDL